jgi:hypothetical protein
MISAIDNFYLQQEEPNQSCLLALRKVIADYSPELTQAWKYSMPFFCYRNKMFCYLWLDKKTREPYIGVVEGGQIDHPALEAGSRSRMKILRIHPEEDIPVDLIYEIFDQAITFYNK